MSTKATALVQYGPKQMEIEELDFPKLIEGSALIRVEANGMCGTDVDSYYGDEIPEQKFPRIIGHEIVGVIEELGPGRNPRPGLKVGDRVAVNPFIGCGRCTDCLRGDTMMCRGFGFWPYMHGQLPLAEAPGLWGGYSTHVYAHPNSVLYPFPEHVSGLTATLWNPLAAGFQWGVINGGVGFGTKLLILGPGQRGLASIFAARAVGAELIVSTGVIKDELKLKRAQDFGADAVINVETENLVERANELTNGEGFDVIVDTTPGATQPIRDAIEVLRPSGGTIA
ncbi:zinc-binding dehydrogenase, partial [Streptomyces sp. NPDC058171]